MDVEKIQRINNLAIELERQGLASGREDAVAQARRIFNVEEQGALDVSQMQEGSLQAAAPEAHAEKTTESTAVPAQPSLSEDKIVTILQKNKDFLVSTIKGFQAKIEVMEGQLAQMGRQIQELRARPTVAPVTRPAETQEATEHAAAAPKSNTTNPQGGDHPRSGGYNDSDVSIEKFFYMGSK